MARIKGSPKTGGRKKGSCNKTTAEIKEFYQLVLSQNLPNIQKWLDKVAEDNPAKALDILIGGISEFVIAKQSRVENDTTISIEKIEPIILTPINKKLTNVKNV